jgi:CBS domain-containing protein
VALIGLNQANELLQVHWFRGRFLAQLMWVNLFIAGFNVLPAFPMDGGRVLRAVLAMRMGRRRATAVAANIGQAMAILFGIVGFFYNPFLIFIAVFVFLGAQGEAAQVEAQSALKGLRVRDAMMTRFRTLSVRDSLAKAVEELLAGSQQDFPVLEDGRVAGILRRNDLVRALAGGDREAPVGGAMCRDCPAVEEAEGLARAVDAMRQQGCATVPVMAGGRLTGLLTLENIGEVVMVSAALAQGGEAGS